MDDIERMRRVLAERGMGWHRGMGHETSEQVDALPCYRSADGTFQCLWCKWDPFASWPQCGMVIEAMREKGWRLVCWVYEDGTMARYFMGDYLSKLENMVEASGSTIPEAVSLAACRALEPADE